MRTVWIMIACIALSSSAAAAAVGLGHNGQRPADPAAAQDDKEWSITSLSSEIRHLTDQGEYRAAAKLLDSLRTRFQDTGWLDANRDQIDALRATNSSTSRRLMQSR